MDSPVAIGLSGVRSWQEMQQTNDDAIILAVHAYALSSFPEQGVYFGGYGCNFYWWNNAAWIFCGSICVTHAQLLAVSRLLTKQAAPRDHLVMSLGRFRCCVLQGFERQLCPNLPVLTTGPQIGCCLQIGTRRDVWTRVTANNTFEEICRVGGGRQHNDNCSYNQAQRNSKPQLVGTRGHTVVLHSGMSGQFCRTGCA